MTRFVIVYLSFCSDKHAQISSIINCFINPNSLFIICKSYGLLILSYNFIMCYRRILDCTQFNCVQIIYLKACD